MLANSPQFVVGEIYRRKELHETWGGPWQSGISPSSSHPVVFIFTGSTGERHGYVDGFQSDGTFWYTGEGQHGDMQLVRGNLTLTTAEADGKELHLFELAKKGFVRYVGRASYLGHHETPGADTEGKVRQILVFEFAIDADDRGAATDVTRPMHEQSARELRALSLSELRTRALAVASSSLPTLERRQVVRQRSDAVREYVLRRANGFCEGCGACAPFVTKAGTPYLEPHHIRRVADGGPDHPRWVIALCPSCHRRVHYGQDGQAYNQMLGAKAADWAE